MVTQKWEKAENIRGLKVKESQSFLSKWHFGAL